MDKRFEGGAVLEYNVFTSGTIASGEYLKDQHVKIVNPNAWFILTGVSGEYDFVGLPAFLLRDGHIRAMSNNPIWMGNLANYFGMAAPLGGGFAAYPPDSSITFDVAEKSGAGASAWSLNFWGYLRFEKGVKPC
jgi:hypothetical protein